MIAEFLDSWSLFSGAYLTGMAVAMLLSLVGLLVVARDQIFLGAAVAQATMFGIAFAIRFEQSIVLAPLLVFGADLAHTIVGGLAAVAGALLTTPRAHARDSAEALTGWVFLAGGSGAVLLVANSPHGLAEVQGLLSSTILGTGVFDAGIVALFAATTIGVFALRTDAVLLFATDAEMARAVGIPVERWNALLAVWLGVSLALAIHVAGTIYAFACLVLPGLIARNLCREVRSMLVVAPAVALVSAIVAFVVANHNDWPPGQTAAALLSVELAATWIARSTLAR
jgi:ABC-type Mn2+/Zn2+ transport system permease subunit